MGVSSAVVKVDSGNRTPAIRMEQSVWIDQFMVWENEGRGLSDERPEATKTNFRGFQGYGGRGVI